MSKLEEINRYILNQLKTNAMDERTAFDILKELNHRKEEKQEIAVIGMACRYPKADNPEEYWANLVMEKNCIRPFPEDRRKDTSLFLSHEVNSSDPYILAGYLEEIDKFDADFFSIPKGEAIYMDPLHRLFLVTAYEAAADAGYCREKFFGSNTGVYVGTDHARKSGEYMNLFEEMDLLSLVGSWPGLLASRVSYAMNLTGPSLVIDTACSSGLVSVHTACQALRNNECRMAIAGGGNIALFPGKSDAMNSLEGNDNCLRAFDKEAKGTLWGEGVGAVLLKPLKQAVKDRDKIYGVIKGSAINNDGLSNGITAPNAKAQESVLIKAWEEAGIEPGNIQYIETHGTGTILGDPIEIQAMNRALKKYTNKMQFCGIGSVKTNIGHTVGASGMASLMKVILGMRYGKIPASINFEIPNPYIGFNNSSVYPVDCLRVWEEGQNTRLAGVTALGFSGTNCHIVVEEYKTKAGADAEENQDYNIFTISGKTPESLKAYLEEVYKFTIENEYEFDSFCYTSCTKKENYNYRIGIIIEKKKDLENKLRYLSRQPLKSCREMRIYYSHEEERHNNEETYNKEDDISVSNKNSLIDERLQIAIQLCMDYCKGVSVDWDNYYSAKAKKTIGYPNHPLDRTRVWYERNQALEPVFQPEYSIAGRKITDSVNEVIYSNQWTKQCHWLTTEHKIFDKSVIPGTAIIEMMLAACSDTLKTSGIYLENIVFLNPLIIEEEPAEVQTILQKNLSRITVAVKYKNDNEWIVCSEGEYTEAVIQRERYIPIDELRKETKEKKLYNKADDHQAFALGNHWDCISHINISETFILIELKDLDENMEGSYICHPALLDCAINGVIRSIGDGVYVPFTYGRFWLITPPPKKWYSLIRLEKQVKYNTEAVKVDIDLIGEDGKVFAQITGYEVKKVNYSYGSAHGLRLNQMLYETVWKNTENPKKPKQVEHETVSVFYSYSERMGNIIKELKGTGRNIVEFPMEACLYGRIPSPLSKGMEENLLLRQLSNCCPDRIIYFADGWGARESQGNEYGIRNLYSLLYLVQILMNYKKKPSVIFQLCTDYAYEITGREQMLKPLNASLIGLFSTIQGETPGLICHCTDTDYETSNAVLVDELLSVTVGGKCGYRQGMRYMEKIKRADSKELFKDDILIDRENTFIVTGGLGGIGLEISFQLAQQAPVNLCLIQRKNFPKKSRWSELLAAGNSEYQRELKLLDQILQTGSKVEIFQADVSDEVQMLKVIEQIHKTMGMVHGVIHAAGIAGGSLLRTQSFDNLDAVIRPKINGTIHLDELLKEDNLKFFVMLSSTIAIQQITGQGAYTAANAFMDSYAARMRKRGRNAISVRFPAWRETGMAAQRQMLEGDMIFRGLSTNAGTELFLKILGAQKSSITAGEIDYKKAVRFAEGNYFVSPSKELVREIARNIEAVNNRTEKIHVEKMPVILMEGRENGQYTDTETCLAGIIAKIIKAESININQTVYETGIDSILGLKIVNTINQYQKKQIGISDFFDYPSVAALASYLDKEEEEKKGYEITKRQHITDKDYALSSMQERIWFLQKMNPRMVAYNLSRLSFLDWVPNIELLNQALKLLGRKHSILRAVFVETEGTPRQRIMDELEVEVEFTDLSSEAEQERILREFIQKEDGLPFELSKQLIRVRLYRLAQNRCGFYVNIHHIITDGWSMQIFTKDLFAFYEALVNQQKIIIDEKQPDYIDWIYYKKARDSEREYKRAEQYWQKEFSEYPRTIELPYDYKHPPIQTYEGSCINFSLTFEETNRLKELSKKADCTLHTILLSAYFLMLHRICGAEDMIVGIPGTGRDKKETEEIIGLFINTLCIRVHLDPTACIRQLTEQVKEKCLRAYENSSYPFDRLVADTNVARDLSRSPVFSTMFQFYDQIPPEQEGRSLYELSVYCREIDSCICGRMEYNTSLFSRNTAGMLSDCYKIILLHMEQCFDSSYSHIPLLSDSHKKQILFDFNKTEWAYEKGAAIHELFREQVKKSYNKIALEYKDSSMTYGELDRKTDALAVILRDRGIGKGDIVAFMTKRSMDIVIAIFGILKAVGVFLPIDKKLPADRIAFMLNDSNAKLLITDQAVGINYRIDILYTYEIENSTEDKGGGSVTKGEDAAYLLYTSGSTGQPKGVIVEHRSLHNFIMAMEAAVHFTECKKILALTTVSFDIFLLETVLPLVLGLCVVIEGEQRELVDIGNDIVKYHVDILQTTPSRMRLLLQNEKVLPMLGRIRKFIIGGERFPKECISKLKELGSNEIYNVYGPTETTIWSSCKLIEKEEEITIGKPIANTKMFILDQNKNLLPPGVKGELYISGDGLARGYLGREYMTREQFTEHPYLPGERIYRTGDMGKWLWNGEIQLSGRNDNQVKLRGYRIELEELEAVFLQETEASACAAAVLDGSYGNQSLAVYYTAPKAMEVPAVKTILSEYLPEYMIPDYYICLERMPYTANRKVDRKALIKLEEDRAKTDTEQAVSYNRTQKQLQTIWMELLEVKNAGINDNFFDLGGNSFLVSIFHSKLDNLFPGVLKVIDIFKYPSIKRLAAYIDAKRDTTAMEEENKNEDTIDSGILSLLDNFEKGELAMEDILKDLENMEV